MLANTSPLYVRRISVEKLFGRYTYEVPLGDLDQVPDVSKLLIVYGDNGSGKTTLLTLVFHLLSPSLNKGHRGALGRVPFRRLQVELSDETVISARRNENSLVGTYDFSFYQEGRLVESSQFAFDEKLKLDKGQRPAVHHLSKLGLALHLLSDDRKIITDLFPNADVDDEDEIRREHLWRLRAMSPSNKPTALDKTISRALDWLRTRALSGSGKGEADANTIYSDIVKRITSPFGNPKSQSKAPDLDFLTRELIQLHQRSVSFAKYGLISEFAHEELLTAISRPHSFENAHLLVEVLRPFIDSTRARMEALDPVRVAIESFVDTLNEFYVDKTVSFDLRAGLNLTTSDGGTLDPNVLSSGEKQLLMLFLNVIGAGAQPSIFIIDEPELSLNVKWQRKLVSALLECTVQSQVQFILATHSLELITQHRLNVSKLTDRESLALESISTQG